MWVIEIKKSHFKGDGLVRFPDAPEGEQITYALMVEDHRAIRFFGANRQEVTEAILTFGLITKRFTVREVSERLDALEADARAKAEIADLEGYVADCEHAMDEIKAAEIMSGKK